MAKSFDHWFAGGEYTSDWVSPKIAFWQETFSPLRERGAVQILEIGSFEGRSATAFLNLLPNSQITCIDSFGFSDGREDRFDRNMEQFSRRVTKIKDLSLNAMPRLIADGRQFDIVYVDGHHWRNSVIADSVFARALVAPEGFILWDDYAWRLDYPSEQRPRDAIDWFLKTFAEEFDVVLRRYQLAVRRRY